MNDATLVDLETLKSVFNSINKGRGSCDLLEAICEIYKKKVKNGEKNILNKRNRPQVLRSDLVLTYQTIEPIERHRFDENVLDELEGQNLIYFKQNDPNLICFDLKKTIALQRHIAVLPNNTR